MAFDLGMALVIAALFAGSAAVGCLARQRTPEEHRSREAVEVIGMVMSLMVTFAAVVLGLVTTSVKTEYDRAGHDRARYAGQLTQLDRCLRNYGRGAEATQAELRGYTAAVVASTWTNEPKPGGASYPDTNGMPRVGMVPALADMMNDIGLAIDRLIAADPARERIATDCANLYGEVQKVRWAVIEDVFASTSAPFFCAVTFWMAVVFAGFGFRAPMNTSLKLVIGLAIVAVTSALVITLDMNEPYGGLFGISSQSMRAALARMDQPFAPPDH